MTNAPNARLFLALWPTAAVRRALAAYRDAWRWQGRPARVRDDKLHVTLHFIGDVPRSRVPDLRAELSTPCAAFDLPFGRPSLWPRGVAVVEPLSVPEALQTLHEALADALRRAGLPVESRPLRPHVTLARHAAHAEFPAEPLDVVWRVEGYALVESRLATGEYRVVERYAASHSLRANSSSSR